MGCDIHFYSETRKNGKWVADHADSFTKSEPEEGETWYELNMNQSYNGGRYYLLFGLLSEGVRYDIPQAFPQRGVPDDASDEIQQIFKSWDCDAHSANHITVAELKEKAAALLVDPDPEAPRLCSALSDVIRGLPPSENPDEQRVVFWFDN